MSGRKQQRKGADTKHGIKRQGKRGDEEKGDTGNSLKGRRERSCLEHRPHWRGGVRGNGEVSEQYSKWKPGTQSREHSYEEKGGGMRPTKVRKAAGLCTRHKLSVAAHRQNKSPNRTKTKL